MKKAFITLVAFVALFGGAFYATRDAAVSFAGFEPVGGTTYYLQSSIGLTNTTITLSSLKNRSGIPLTMMVLNTDIVYGTLDPQTSRSEFISFTGIVQNSNGTATLTGVVRGLADIYPFTASSTMVQSHAGQSAFIISNTPQFQNEYAVKRNNEVIPGAWIFSSTSPPHYDVDPVWANFSGLVFADVNYVNSVVAGGAANASETVKGIVQLATAAQAALGTSIGSTVARLALPASLSTSTPGLATVTGNIPISVGRFLVQSWLDLTASWTFSLLNATNATTTGNQYFSNAALTSTLLKTDSTGKLVPALAGIDYTREKYTYASTTSFTVTGNTSATTTLFSIPAGTMNASSSINLYAPVTCTNGTTCTLNFRTTLSGSLLATCSFNAPSAADATGMVQVILSSSNGTATSWRYNCSGVMTNGTSPFALVVSGSGTSAVDLTGATTFYLGIIGLNGTGPHVDSLNVILQP